MYWFQPQICNIKKPRSWRKHLPIHCQTFFLDTTSQIWQEERTLLSALKVWQWYSVSGCCLIFTFLTHKLFVLLALRRLDGQWGLNTGSESLRRRTVLMDLTVASVTAQAWRSEVVPGARLTGMALQDCDICIAQCWALGSFVELSGLFLSHASFGFDHHGCLHFCWGHRYYSVEEKTGL